MTGFDTIRLYHDVKERAEKLGLEICPTKHGNRYPGGLLDNSMISLMPLGNDSLPIYSRDAEVFIGTLEDAGCWLTGVEWARDYDSMLFGNRHNNKRERKEQDERNKRLVKILKDEHIELKEKV